MFSILSACLFRRRVPIQGPSPAPTLLTTRVPPSRSKPHSFTMQGLSLKLGQHGLHNGWTPLPDMLKLVHYVARVSVYKWVVGILLKYLLVQRNLCTKTFRIYCRFFRFVLVAIMLYVFHEYISLFIETTKADVSILKSIQRNTSFIILLSNSYFIILNNDYVPSKINSKNTHF